jgi:hypothetical protein
MEVEGIGDSEVDAQLAPLGLSSRCLDGARCNIDADDLHAASRQHQGVLAGAAPTVEHWLADLAGIGQANEGWLRSTDVPRRLTVAVALIPLRTDAAGGWLWFHTQSLSALGSINS